MNQRDILALEKTVLERSFRLFVQDAWQHIDGDEFIPGMHVDAICEHLQAVAEGRLKRLLINIPPGFAKSLLVSVLYPAWVWTTQPEHKFLSTSFQFDLSQRDSRKMRQLVMSDWYQLRWPIALKGDQNEKANFENQSSGKRVVKAYNSLTGDRGNTVIVDDPHSVHLGWNDTDRKAVVQTFKAAVPSRLHSRKRDSIIVVMQRLHQEDVSGYILDHPEQGYVHLCIPQEYEGNADPNGLGWCDPRTSEGELICPELMGEDEVRKEREQLGPVDYAGQHQQTPTPREAGELDPALFNRFDHFVTGLQGEKVQGWPFGCTYYMTSDHAISETGDFNVFRVWAYDSQKNLWLVDSFRKKCTLQEAVGIEFIEGKMSVAPFGAMALIRKWRPHRFYPEDDNNFKVVEPFLRSAMRDAGLFVDIRKQSPHGKNKVAKVQGYKSLAHQGRIYIPKGPVGDTALAEYQTFPTGKHDDQVDADGMIGRVIDQLIAGYTAAVDDEDQPDFGYKSGFKADATDADTFFI